MSGWGGGDAPDSVAELEAENVVRQHDHLYELIARHLSGAADLIVTPSLVCVANRLAVDGLTEHPGVFRDGPARICGSQHEPPSFEQVPSLVQDMCSTIEGGALRGIDVAAYALWRINWIHPFEDGNGRTARAIAYLLICRHLRMVLKGEPTLVGRIAQEKLRYQRCLEAADRAWARKPHVNVADMSGFLARLVREQLREAGA